MEQTIDLTKRQTVVVASPLSSVTFEKIGNDWWKWFERNIGGISEGTTEDAQKVLNNLLEQGFKQ